MTTTATRRYTIISSDCHAGGSHAEYREYLPKEYVDDFDAWRGKYSNPFRDLQDDGRSRNWDDDRRNGDLDTEGVAGEVVFPNTVPPFFPTGVVIAPAPANEDLPIRLVGIRAHNRWLADFQARHPQRRVGLGQFFLNDVDEAIADVRTCHSMGIRHMLLPGVSPDTPWISPLFTEHYDRLWAVCEELGVTLTHHSGGTGLPNYPDTKIRPFLFAMETSFFCNRALWHMIMSGVFERFPTLKVIFTEQGSGWFGDALRRMDAFHHQIANGRMGELGIDTDAVLPMLPSEYFQRNVWIGASFPSPREANALKQIGVDKVMWGSDYPHHEGSSPFSREALRLSFHDWDEADLRKVLAGNAAEVYGFDLEPLDDLAAEIGPTVEELQVPLDARPKGATSPCFFQP